VNASPISTVTLPIGPAVLAVERFSPDERTAPGLPSLSPIELLPRHASAPSPPGWPGAWGSGACGSGWPAAGRGMRRSLLGELKGWAPAAPSGLHLDTCGCGSDDRIVGVLNLGRHLLPGP